MLVPAQVQLMRCLEMYAIYHQHQRAQVRLRRRQPEPQVDGSTMLPTSALALPSMYLPLNLLAH